MTSPEREPSTTDEYGAADPTALVHAAFDAEFYLADNPDVAAAGVDAWEHYSTIGWREGRNPESGFSVADYLAAHPDVAISGVDPFSHFVLYGRAEGRKLSLSHPEPNQTSTPAEPDLLPVLAEFDADYYVAANPDVELKPEAAFGHFLETGWRENRDPTRWFSTRCYLEANTDVVETGANPFVHYVLYGRREGRDRLDSCPA